MPFFQRPASMLLAAFAEIELRSAAPIRAAEPFVLGFLVGKGLEHLGRRVRPRCG